MTITHHLEPLLLVPAISFALTLAWLPGLAILACLRRRVHFGRHFTLVAIWAVSAAVAYGVFWTFFAHRALGIGSSMAVLGGAALLMMRKNIRASAWQIVNDKDFAVPAVATVAVALFHLGILFARGDGTGWDWPNEARERLLFPDLADDMLPGLLASRLFDGQPVIPFFGDWLASDRPPLQASLILGQLGWWRLFGFKTEAYQAIGTAAQTVWIAGFWALSRTFVFSPQRTVHLIAVIAATGFAYVNGVFVWPKMVGAGFTLAAVALVLSKDNWSGWWLGLYFVLGLLAHGGLFFTLFPLTLVCLVQVRNHRFRDAVLAAAVILALQLPWTAYQQFHDPPGNRLVKWHLAGSKDVDERNAFRAITDAYSRSTWSEIVERKKGNLTAVVSGVRDWYLSWLTGTGSTVDDLPGAYLLEGMTNKGSPHLVYRLRELEFQSTAAALGLFHAGWPLLILAAVARNKIAVNLGVVALFAVAALSFWIIVMFGPATTIVHQGSYATMLLVYFVLGAALLEFAGRFAAAAWTITQGVTFIAIWTPRLGPSQWWCFGGLFLVCLALGILVLLYVRADSRVELDLLEKMV